MLLTDEQVELFAIRAAKGNNGGEWATHYADEHKEYWRSFVRDMALALSDIHESARRMSFQNEWYLEGLRNPPGDYVLMRLGPVTSDEIPF